MRSIYIWLTLHHLFSACFSVAFERIILFGVRCWVAKVYVTFCEIFQFHFINGIMINVLQNEKINYESACDIIQLSKYYRIMITCSAKKGIRLVYFHKAKN
jgi:hypothetical protein